MLCDFCSVQDVGWDYPAYTFQHSATAISCGDWHACNQCHNLIQENMRDELAARSYENMKEAVKFPVSFRERLLSEIRELHDMFFENMSGLPRRYKRSA